MEFLADFLNITAITCLVVGLLVFIAPNRFKNKKTGAPPNRNIALIRAICGAVLFFCDFGHHFAITENGVRP